jgi:hypothetical protein
MTRWTPIRKAAVVRDIRDGDQRRAELMPMVRVRVSTEAGRIAATLLWAQMPDGVLVGSAALGRASDP